MDNIHRPTWVQIDLQKIKKNLNTLRSLISPDEFFCPMIKANAYGHGDIQVAKVLESEGVVSVGVALVDEGVHLRQASIGIKNIIVFQPIQDEKFLRLCIEYKLTPVLTRLSDFDFFEKLKMPLEVHIKFNTGMTRLGFPLSDFQVVQEKVKSNANVKVRGICTHVHTGEDILMPVSSARRQLDHLLEIKKLVSDEKIYFHALNSVCLKGLAHMAADLKTQYEMGARPGLALYGIHPEMDFPKNHKPSSVEFSVEPVLSWHTRVVQMQKLRKGQSVSYGARWTASRDTTIAVLPVGYADGFRRGFSNNGQVLIGDQLLPIVGTVCMDYSMVDLGTYATQCKINEEVRLLGNSANHSLNAHQLAAQIQTNAYEIVTCISNRVPRICV